MQKPRGFLFQVDLLPEVGSAQKQLRNICDRCLYFMCAFSWPSDQQFANILDLRSKNLRDFRD